MLRIPIAPDPSPKRDEAVKYLGPRIHIHKTHASTYVFDPDNPGMEEHVRIHLDTDTGGDAVKKQAASLRRTHPGALLLRSQRLPVGMRAQPHEGVHERT